MPSMDIFYGSFRLFLIWRPYQALQDNEVQQDVRQAQLYVYFHIAILSGIPLYDITILIAEKLIKWFR